MTEEDETTWTDFQLARMAGIVLSIGALIHHDKLVGAPIWESKTYIIQYQSTDHKG